MKRTALWTYPTLAVVALSLLVITACEYKRAALFKAVEPGYSDLGDEELSGPRKIAQSTDGATLALVSAERSPRDTPRKIIRNGSLQLVVLDVDQASNRIRSVVENVGGFVEKATQTNVSGRTATISVRVPADSLDKSMAQIKGLATSVDREEVQARDVTREFVDLDARLRNARAEEERYLEILKKATTIKDTLDGAEKLSNVRGRIEQLQGEMNYLSSQIAMSALEISLVTEAGSTVLGVRWRPLHHAKIATGEMISGFADWADSVIAFFINLPLIVVWAASIIALLFVSIRVLVFLWRKLGPKATWRWPWGRVRGEMRQE
jgi:hypothetical protein